MVESSALLKRRTPKGYRGFESLPHRQLEDILSIQCSILVLRSHEPEIRTLFDRWGAERTGYKKALRLEPTRSVWIIPPSPKPFSPDENQ